MNGLGLSFFVHLIGIVLWLGPALLMPLVLIPAIRALEPAAQTKFMQVFWKRYFPLFVIGGIVVGLSGWFQDFKMDAGLKDAVIKTKHVVILPLILVSVYIWLFLARKLTKPIDDSNGTWRKLVSFSWIQLVLSVAVLFLTGWLTE